MASSFLNPEQQKPRVVDWARLIPGETPAFRGNGKKPVQSVRPVATERVSEIEFEAPASKQESALTLLLPGPLQSRMACRWVCSMAVDFALVTLNWLSIGALLVPLRVSFPHVRTFSYAAGAPASLLGIALLHGALITLMGYTQGLQAEGSDLGSQARILGKSVLWATALMCCVYGLQGVPWPTSGLFCGAGLLHFGALWAWRWQSARQARRAQQAGELRNVLIVGAGAVGRRVASYMEKHPEAGRRVSGFLDNEKPLGNGVIGRVTDLARLARTAFVDEVILAAPHDRSLTLAVLREARRLRLDVEIVPELFGCKPAGRDVERVGDLPVICLHAERLPAAGLILKRVADVALAGMALTVLSPLLVAITGLIKLDSRGPVLYCAKRVGRKGRPFRCYKFRTMVSNADTLKEHLRRNNQRSGPFFKIADDPRITRLGRFLRRYSLDELPQLWNVVKGDMSLVGPRPHPLDDVAGYEIEHLSRLDVTPGITGLWQVTARRDPSFQRGMDLDREYIRTWSLRADMRILLKTFLAVAQGSGD
ncbi:MAG TPA: sugar transferase [Candidatus Sulfotelmatobacter sp.]|nr:sugar transferase [Candidatus Sulfotelmatobacter sp.]